MNTVTDQTNLQSRVVFDRAEIDRLRWFQTTRYFESGLLEKLPSRLDDDGYVDSSTYLGVYKDSEICGTVRIVRSDSALPMLAHHPIDPEVLDYLSSQAGAVAEVSRLAVARNTHPHQALAMLIREFLRFGFRNDDATLMIASVGKPLIRILSRVLGMPLQIIGPSIDQYGEFKAETIPILIDTVECLENFRKKSTRNWEFFVEDLVIDLTTSPTPASATGQVLTN